MQTNKSNSVFFQPKLSVASAARLLGVSIQAIHQQLKAKEIACPKFGNKLFITHDSAKQIFNLNFKKKKIAAQIVKGGTGKTTTIENIASCVNAYGAKVLKIDIDPQANLTDSSGVDPENLPVLVDVIKGEADIEDCIISVAEGVDLIASRIENSVLDNEIVNRRLPLDRLFNNLLEPISDQYDFIFIDCPATLGQSVAATTLYVDTVVVPLNPNKYSEKGLTILKKEVQNLEKAYKKQINYMVYLNKFSGKTVLSDKAVGSLISDPDLEGRILSTTIPLAQEIENLTDKNRNVFLTLSRSMVRDDFELLTQELLEISPNSTTKVNQSLDSIEATY